MKKSVRKLVLAKETLRDLCVDDLRPIVGGSYDPMTTCTCPQASRQKCLTNADCM